MQMDPEFAKVIEKVFGEPPKEIIFPREAKCTYCGHATKTNKKWKVRCSKCHRTVKESVSYPLWQIPTKIKVPKLVFNVNVLKLNNDSP